PPGRPVPARLQDWRSVKDDLDKDPEALHRQAGRCMDCGIPFCHQGCPLGNLIPEWNDFAWRDRWQEAIDRLHATNNFPEFTGRVCPAPCETSCVLGINQPPVTIKNVEVSIIDKAFEEGLVTPIVPKRSTGRTVAVVGSGPSGLAAAQQLTRAGHAVTVYEREDRLGGLLRYGVPSFKMEKHHIDRRVEQMTAEGTRFLTGVDVGVDPTWDALRSTNDAVLIATGASVPRDLPVVGRAATGIHFAMPYLTQANRASAGEDVEDQITAKGKHVVIIGGGDTGSDGLGTALRQGATSVTTLAIGMRPLEERDPRSQPWPTHPLLFEVSTSHEEGGEREFWANTVEFLADENGHLEALRVARTEIMPDGSRGAAPSTEREIPAELVLIAMGFTGPDTSRLVQQVGTEVTSRGSIARDNGFATTAEGVFVAGDAGRGQSLVVWAIAEGRAAAAAIDVFLMGSTELPAPITPRTLALRAP
ncbi:MAG: glutamate synthase subunit beta, partial [Demequinaceae bacterium]|nr:glutamate synthase subunit beta [Demequinaceae bacterium]